MTNCKKRRGSCDDPTCTRCNRPCRPAEFDREQRSGGVDPYHDDGGVKELGSRDRTSRLVQGFRQMDWGKAA